MALGIKCPQSIPYLSITEHYSPLSPKIACPQAMPTQLHNQSTEPTKFGDDPRVPNYPKRSIAPSAQSTALHCTIPSQNVPWKPPISRVTNHGVNKEPSKETS